MDEKKPSLREQLGAIVDSLRAKIAPPETQRDLLDKAMLLKQQNAHRLRPFTGLELNNPRLISESVFVTCHPKFKGNPYYVRRGLDPRTEYATTRAIRRNQKLGYNLPMPTVMARWKAMTDVWARVQDRLGYGLLTRNRSLKEWQFAAKAE